MIRGAIVATCVPTLLVVAALSAPSRPTASSGSAAVARVGPLAVTRQQYEERLATGMTEYRKRAGASLSTELEVLLKRQILESLIRANLLILEGERRGLGASEAEAESQLKTDPIFQQGGKYLESRYQAIKAANPEAYRVSIQRIRGELAARKLNARIFAQYQPEDARIRAAAEKALARANVDYLALRLGEFPGGYPEPSESEVLAWYHAHASEYRRPARSVLSMITIGAPDGSDPPAAGSPEAKAWQARIKQRADSALTAIRSGKTFDEVGEDLGGVRRNVVVVPDNFPGAWRGDAATNAEVLRAAPGTLLREPVPAADGWLLVRVDEAQPAHVATLAEVSKEIRSRLREESRLHHDDKDLLALYQTRKDSLKSDAWRMRYAMLDLDALDPGEPAAADLDRFYRGHQADYSSYDAATASIRTRPLAEVRDEVRRRWREERRILKMRSLAGEIEKAWSSSRRDRTLERQATVREVAPFLTGAVVDTGLAGRILSDTLAQRGTGIGTGALAYPRGLVVYDVYAKVPDLAPSFEQARTLLQRDLQSRRDADEERAARAFFDQDPQRFAGGPVIHFTRLGFEAPGIIDVPLTRQEVERYHRDHIDKYSSGEQVRARHILISPTGPGEEADRAARQKAEDLLKRIRAGEDFEGLARRYSDDPPTREQGGDLGTFGRGAMLDPVERAAFSLKPGEVSGVVKSEVGYHIIKLLDHQPLVARPLVEIYGNVGADAAVEKGQRMVRAMADSVYHAIRTPAEGRAAAKKLKLPMNNFTHVTGNTAYPMEVRASMARLEAVPPGKIYPGVENFRGFGWVIQWVDSVSPPTPGTWDQVRMRAIEIYRRGAGMRALEAKRAELDSLTHAGWSFDSLAALWGGPEHERGLASGTGLKGLGGADAVDSLVFGGRHAPALDRGEVSDWFPIALGLARLRVAERIAPSPNKLAARVEQERRATLEYGLFGFYEELKHRFPVRILDPELRGVALPPPPEPTSL